MMKVIVLLAVAAVTATPALADAPVPDLVIPVAKKGGSGALARIKPHSIPALGRRTPRREGDGVAVEGQTQAWWDGAVYRLMTAPGRVSDVALQPGETLIAVAAGDTARWVIGDTTSGSGITRRTHILVKPAASGLRTNLVIATDRRVYHLELETGGSPATSLSWTYPEDALLALEKKQSAVAEPAPVAAPVAVERLNFNYAIDGDSPSWRPVRAFDDGRQVFVEFPPALRSGEAPPLFVVGASGAPELVNYRQRGRYYIVDRLFSAAELRLGERRQQVVRITRSDGARERDGGRSR
jgi:type IV secretion system protein VirB9